MTLLTELGDRPGLAVALQNAAWGNLMARPEVARDYFGQSLEIAREIGDDHIVLSAAQGLALAQFRLGDYDSARASATMTSGSRGALQDRFTSLFNIMTLGAIDLLEGNMKAAAGRFADALERACEASSDVGISVTLDAVSHFAFELNDLQTAVKIAAAAERMRGNIGGAPSMALVGWPPTVDVARERDASATDAAIEEARSMTTDDAVELARAFLKEQAA